VIAVPLPIMDGRHTAKNKFQIEYFRSFSLSVGDNPKISIRFSAIQAKAAGKPPLRPDRDTGYRRACTLSMHELHASCLTHCYCCNNSPR
jgi:hypothetical protein